MHKLTVLLACGILCGLAPAAPGADPDPVALLDVTVIDVEDGSRRRGQDVVLGANGIEAIGPHGSIPIPRHAVRHDAGGRFLIPSFWDLHVHAHRDRRWTYQHPLLLAHGVTLVRDAGSHLGSALAARERVAADPLAPDVIWGSPPIEGAPPFNSFGLAAEDGPSAQRLVRELHTLGFDFVKVYDGLSREAYFALTEEARRLGMPVEGHVPLRVSPDEAVAAGQRLVDHLTLMVERCIPGVLDWVGVDGTSDSMTLLSDGRLAAALPRFDPALCAEQMQLHRRAGVWHVPTLVQMRGFFHADDPAVTEDPRARWVPSAVRDAWREHARRARPESLAAGRAVLDRQMELVGAMHRAGVRLLAGTDTSAEPWVFAGSSLHDELGLLVEAGLTPVAALRAATVDARMYAGRGAPRLIAPGQPADLVLLDADPTEAIANTRRIHAVIRRGRFLGRPELDALLERARAAAAAPSPSPAPAAERFCDLLPRPANRALKHVGLRAGWFEVYEVQAGVFALVEPYQFQEVISYLVLGEREALLFDTGMGIGPIARVVKELTSLPVTVLNSHTHFDHVGGNADFERVLALDTAYTRANLRGFPPARLRGEVADEALCRGLPPGFEAAAYHTRAWTAARFVADGHRVDLGGRVLEVLHVPGHTPDAVALLDRAAGLLFTGDTFYEGPIWLFVPETDLAAYARSVERLAALVPGLTRLLPAHNAAGAPPARLLAVGPALAALREGRVPGTPSEGGQVTFTFEGFSIVTSRDALAGKTDATRGGSGLPPS